MARQSSPFFGKNSLPPPPRPSSLSLLRSGTRFRLSPSNWPPPSSPVEQFQSKNFDKSAEILCINESLRQTEHQLQNSIAELQKSIESQEYYAPNQSENCIKSIDQEYRKAPSDGTKKRSSQSKKSHKKTQSKIAESQPKEKDKNQSKLAENQPIENQINPNATEPQMSPSDGTQVEPDGNQNGDEGIPIASQNDGKFQVFIHNDYEGNLFQVYYEFIHEYDSDYDCQTTRNGIKACLTSQVDLCNFENVLKRHKIPYSLSIKTKKTNKYVVKGLHHKVEPAQISNLLRQNGFKVEKVVNMTSFKTKKPMPMHLIELLTDQNSDEILQVDAIAGFRVKVEKYKRKRTPPQCSKCQKYYHTAGNCRAPERCRICAGSHQTKSCPNQSGTPKCCHCSGEHTANYKGCPAYQDLRKNHTVAKRNKKKNPPANQRQNSNPPGAQGVNHSPPKNAKKPRLVNKICQTDSPPPLEEAVPAQSQKQLKNKRNQTDPNITNKSANVLIQTGEHCTCGKYCPAYNKNSLVHDLAELMENASPNLTKSVHEYIKKLYDKYRRQSETDNQSNKLQSA